MEFKDYYKILDVAEDADLKAVKTAYRKLARKYHPDVSEKKDAAERFKEVAEAYEVLGDEKKRAEYDEIRRFGGQRGRGSGSGGFEGFSGGDSSHYSEQDFSDFFSSIFGGGRQRTSGFGFGDQGDGAFSTRGRDIEVDMPIFLEDVLSDESKQISYSLPHYDVSGQRLEDITKTLKIKIPKGVADGERIRLKAQGAPGIGNGPAGDLYLRIRLVPHPLFDVEAHNLLITLPLAPWEAALGGKVTVPTLQGKIQLTIPASSQSGQRLRIKGRGLPMKNGNGDLFAVLKIVMPDGTDDDSRKLWQQLADRQSGFNPRQDWS
ncbi:curved DNA-binding protein [Pseudohongiella spirulinae]|uniref:DNA-binding protein n=1 Tax=Pseudohongiella spirulinae TaxID=1249552 RepID=A0A0S2KG96_9GAMM|nr:curved DNA-binding protein [Pseudohongiella spirulinae]ALO47345.1 DNA-binding protein [Pseudohongiella spirulinae]